MAGLCTPVNASPRPSRATAHDSGPMWIANPSSQGTCTLYSLPVSRRTQMFSAVPPTADVGRRGGQVSSVPDRSLRPRARAASAECEARMIFRRANSIATFWPSTTPASFKRWRNAATPSKATCHRRGEDHGHDVERKTMQSTSRTGASCWPSVSRHGVGFRTVSRSETFGPTEMLCGKPMPGTMISVFMAYLQSAGLCVGQGADRPALCGSKGVTGNFERMC